VRRRYLFPTFRSQLLWNYWLTLGLTITLCGGMVVTAVLFFLRTDRVIQSPTELARISTDLNDVHQYLTNYVNYTDDRFIGRFLTALAELERQFEAYAATAHGTSRQHRDIEFWYAYLEIRNQLQWYRDRSEFLLERAGSGEEDRFSQIDRLYQVRDLKARITSALSDLLFRHMTYVQGSYDVYRQSMQRQWVALFIAFGIMVPLLVRWAGRQARMISEPIQHLIRQGQKIAAQNYDVEQASGVGNQELQELNHTFQVMAQEVSRSIELASQKNDLERKNLEMSQSIKQAELELLQSQINPHFLFNTLNTIASLAQIESAEQTERLLASFSTFLRYNLKNMHSIIEAWREVEMIEHYLFIQKQRFGRRLEYHVTIDNAVREYRIPSLTIQPLVENALIHGIEPVRAGGRVTVEVRADDSAGLVVRVTDSGVGICPEIVERLMREPAAASHSRDHVGLENTLRRIRLFDPGVVVLFESADETGNQSGTAITIRLRSPLTDADHASVLTGSAGTEPTKHL
jgi:sensor histidine kinase YesM